ncbi:hypothetical protein B0H13DRAFT_1875560 [Mycena leptocephala]|nr:hypothetical protein B0H13DRAFT_1875560 [Mycena leptocephala]
MGIGGSGHFLLSADVNKFIWTFEQVDVEIFKRRGNLLVYPAILHAPPTNKSSQIFRSQELSLGQPVATLYEDARALEPGISGGLTVSDSRYMQIEQPAQWPKLQSGRNLTNNMDLKQGGGIFCCTRLGDERTSTEVVHNCILKLFTSWGFSQSNTVIEHAENRLSGGLDLNKFLQFPPEVLLKINSRAITSTRISGSLSSEADMRRLRTLNVMAWEDGNTVPNWWQWHVWRSASSGSHVFTQDPGTGEVFPEHLHRAAQQKSSEQATKVSRDRQQMA